MINMSFVRRAIYEQSGQALPWLVLSMVGILGVSGFSIDAGHAYVVRSQLQNAANAGALAAAGNVYNTSSLGTATAIAGQYAGSSGDLNVGDSLVSIKTTVWTKCLNSLMPAGTTCGSGSPANSVVVTESASVPTFFMKVLGMSTIPVVAQATASMQGMAQPWNVAIIVDTTGSMATVDSNCGAMTELQCALDGVQNLLAVTNPNCPAGSANCPTGANFQVGLFTFPNVLTAVNGALPKVGSTTYDSIKNDINCGGTPATYKNYTAQPLAAPYTLPVPGKALPTYGATGWAATRSTYQSGLEYLTYSNKVGTTTTTWEATYQITPFLSDYYLPSSTSTGGLNTSSNLVKAIGYANTSGCLTYTLGIDGTGSGSGFGNTYFASSIYAAQAALAAAQTANPKSKNAIIFLSDGQANASYFTKDKSAYGGSSPYYNSTNQFNDATEFPEAPAGSEVGPSTSSYPVPAYYTPATILTAQNALGYDTLSSSAAGGTRSGTSVGTYPDWNDQCQQAIVAAQYAVGQGTRVYSVAYGSEASGCSNGWSVGATDTTGVATGTNQPFTGASLLPCTTMENIASSWDYFYSDNLQTGNVNLGCTDNNHSTVSLQDIFLAIASTFTGPRLLPNNAQ
jgi:hypothetical protein